MQECCAFVNLLPCIATEHSVSGVSLARDESWVETTDRKNTIEQEKLEQVGDV